jgi:hypothetical protein
MSESAQDPLRRIYSGDKGFINETRLLQRIDENFSKYRGILDSEIVLISGFAAAATIGVSTFVWAIETFLTGVIFSMIFCCNVIKEFRTHALLEQEIFEDSRYYVRQRHQNQQPHEKYDPQRECLDLVKFFYDHPNMTPSFFRLLEERANDKAREYSSNVQRQEIKKSMDYQREVLRLTVKRTIRAHGTKQQKSIVNSTTDHRDMFIELARDDNGLTGINILRRRMGWDLAR